jgi:hypothetical protein
MHRVARAAVCAVTLAAAMALPAPAVASACADGETGVTNGCAPFCLPGKQLDLQTGLCQPVPPPPPPQPAPAG